MYLSRNTVSSSPSMTDPYSPGSPDLSVPPPPVEGVPLTMAKPPNPSPAAGDGRGHHEGSTGEGGRSSYVPQTMERHLRAMTFDKSEYQKN